MRKRSGAGGSISSFVRGTLLIVLLLTLSACSRPAGPPSTEPPASVPSEDLPGGIAAAIEAAGSNPTTIQYKTDQIVSADLSIPAHIELLPLNGAKLLHGGYAVAYPGDTSRWPDKQIFSGTGPVSGLKVSKVVWFGENSDPSTNTATIRKAIAAVKEGGTVKLGVGTWVFAVDSGDDPVFWTRSTSPKNFDLEGHGRTSSILKVQDNAPNYDYLFNHAGTSAGVINYRDFTLDENIQNNPLSAASNLFSGYPRIALSFRGAAGLNVERIEIKNTNGVNQITTSVPGSIIRNNVFRVGYDAYSHDVSTIYTNAPGCRIMENDFYGVQVTDETGKVLSYPHRTAIETHGGGHVVTSNNVHEYSKGANITGIYLGDSDGNHIAFNSFWNVQVGITLYSHTSGTHTSGYGLSNTTVADNLIRLKDYGFSSTFSLAGVQSYTTMDLPMKSIFIRNNSISYDLTVPAHADANQRHYRSGVSLYTTTSGDIPPHENVVIENNEIEGAPTAGILVKGKYRGLRIEGNTVKDCWSQNAETYFLSGVHVRTPDARSVTVRDNTILDTRSTTLLRKGIVLETEISTQPFAEASVTGNLITWAGLPPFREYLFSGANVKPLLEASVSSLSLIDIGAGVQAGSWVFDRGTRLTYRNYTGGPEWVADPPQ